MFPSSPFGFVAGTLFSILLLAGAYGDLRNRRIPNRLVVLIASAGLGYSTVYAQSLGGLTTSIGGIAVGLICWLPFYALGWLGAGDVKLFAAAGAWLGPARALEGSLVAALLGAVLALFWMARVRGVRHSLETLGIAASSPGVLSAPSNVAETSRTLPYAVAVAAGALAAGWLPLFLFR